MLEEAYALGEQDALEYAVKVAAEAEAAGAAKPGLKDRMMGHLRSAKSKVKQHGGAAVGYVKKHPKKFGAGGAALAAAGGGAAYYNSRKK